MIEQLVEAITSGGKKIYGVHDLERKLDLQKDSLSDDILAEVCRQLRDEHVIAYIQGKGIFKHIRITE